MGVDFYCVKKTFKMSYSSWGELRSNIIKATLHYIQDKFDKDKQCYNDVKQGEENYIGEGSEYYCYMNYLYELKKIVLEQKPVKNEFGMTLDNTLINFVRMCNDVNIMNALNYFEIGGLFVLCNQSDCEGYYTPGNSLDICSLLDRIEPFIKNYGYDFIYEEEEDRGVNTVYSVFEYSYKTFKKVTIA